MANTTENQILDKISAQPYTAYTAKDFLDVASYQAARKALQRLTNAGTLRRPLRGVYERPEYSQVRKGPASPNPEEIAQAIARSHGWTLIPNGETALNLLGLSTQVPAQWTYLSDGPSKTYEWDGGALHFRHGAKRDMAGLSPTTALLVQALKSLGEDCIDNTVLDQLRTCLTHRERQQALQEAQFVTTWVYAAIKRLTQDEATSHA